MEDFVYKPQDIDYLGFLEAQLRDLRGTVALAHELIQNADDAAYASRLTFNVTDGALIVENDGLFRDVDFARLQRIAGGDKRAETGTTGAFGLGFIVVYHVTDAPEILSNGRHWRIRPDAPADRRIEERSATSEGTQFLLPWAFDTESPVRRALRLAPIQPDQLDDFARQLAEAIEPAALFLRRLQRLEVKRSDRLIRRVARQMSSADELVLTDETGQSSDWLMLRGDFDEEAGDLRRRYPWQIEENRHSAVRLAIQRRRPSTTLESPGLRLGRLYATLPSESIIPLPIQIDADFFPSVDRTGIHFEGGYQAEWNQAAVTEAARLLAAELERLPSALGPFNFWQLLQRAADVQQNVDQGGPPALYSRFWQALAPRLPGLGVVFTARDEWRRPADVRLMPPRSETAAADLLAALEVPVPHLELAPFSALLARAEVGAPRLSVADVAKALRLAGLTRPTPLSQAPPPLRELVSWRIIWQLLDGLLGRHLRPEERGEALGQLAGCSLALSQNMVLQPLRQLYRGSAETRALFPAVAWLHQTLPANTFPGRFVPEFGVRQAVEWLGTQSIDQLGDDWRFGRGTIVAGLPDLFRWFEAHQIEIFADDPALQHEIRRLPLVPIDGELKPLSGLYLPGGFADPLKLAGVIDLEAIGGRRQFLADLGLAELDFMTYVHGPMQAALIQHPKLPSDARQELVRLLSQRLGGFRDDADLQAQLGELPLVACMDGSFRRGREVYSGHEARELLGERLPIAEPVDSLAIQALHRWLGVRQQPDAADIVRALLAYGREQPTDVWAGVPADELARAAIDRCWRRLGELLTDRAIDSRALVILRDQPVMPNSAGKLSRPDQLILVDDPELAGRFSDLANFLVTDDHPAFARAAIAAGVRPLSQAATLEVILPDGAAEDMSLQAYIGQRRGLIVRLLSGDAPRGLNAETAHALSLLDGLTVMVADDLTIRFRLTLAGEEIVTDPEPATAKLLPEAATLYIAVGGEDLPWPAVAREFAAALHPNRPPGSLAIGIREILAAPDAAAASRLLDELGYP